MELGLLRHADALAANGGSIPTDASRPLSPKGRRQARDVGVFLGKSGLVPELIVTSPFIRALETAEGVLEGLGMEVPLVKVPALACEVRTALQAEGITRALEDAGLGKRARVLAVAHMPDLALLAAHFMDGNQEALGFEKAGLAWLEFPGKPVESLGQLVQWTNPDLHALVAGATD